MAGRKIITALFIFVLGICAFRFINVEAAVNEIEEITIISHPSEVKTNMLAQKGILYSKEYTSTPRIYSITITERGWLGKNTTGSGLANVEIYTDDSLQTRIEEPIASLCFNDDGFYNDFRFIYLDPGTYYIKDNYYDAHVFYGLFLPDSKMVTHKLEKNKDGKSYTDTVSFVPKDGVTYLVSGKVDRDKLYDEYGVWAKDKITTNIFDKYTITENGDYTVKVEFSDPDWQMFKVMYSFTIDDLGEGASDKDKTDTTNDGDKADKDDKKDKSEKTEEVKLNYTNVTIKVGEKLKLKVNGTKAVSFKSSKKSVAKVKASGSVIAKKAGKTTIKVMCDNGQTYTCKVTVQK